MYESFSNDPSLFFQNINNLPKELYLIVDSYIPAIAKIQLNKELYVKYHHLFRDCINRKQLENYIRTTVRQDNDFVFDQLLNENYKRWINMKKYYYKNCIYSNYIIFLESYAIDNESTKCRKKIVDLFQELGLSKNQHKKNITKYIRWKT